VSVMATYQLGRSLDRDQVGKIVAFLETLSGQQPELEPPDQLLLDVRP
jgi:cytochrome c peroxidase